MCFTDARLPLDPRRAGRQDTFGTAGELTIHDATNEVQVDRRAAPWGNDPGGLEVVGAISPADYVPRLATR